MWVSADESATLRTWGTGVEDVLMTISFRQTWRSWFGVRLQPDHVVRLPLPSNALVFTLAFPPRFVSSMSRAQRRTGRSQTPRAADPTRPGPGRRPGSQTGATATEERDPKAHDHDTPTSRVPGAAGRAATRRQRR